MFADAKQSNRLKNRGLSPRFFYQRSISGPGLLTESSDEKAI